MDVRTHEYISIPTFYRLKLPTLLPNVKRVIYFDCDFVVTSSLAKLFNVNMGDYPIAGVKDISKNLLKLIRIMLMPACWLWILKILEKLTRKNPA